MKSHFFLLIFGLIIFSCSSDDTDSGTNTTPEIGDYFPSSLNDSWIYTVENTSTTNPEVNFSGTDVVTVNAVTANTFTVEINDGTTPANGTMNAIFSTGTFTKSETSLEYSGNLALLTDLGILPDTDINLTGFVLYDLDAESNSQLYIVTDSFTEDIDLNGFTAPITANYEITNTNKTSLSSLIVNDVAYANVVHTEIKLNLSINTVIDVGFPLTLSVLDAQDVLVINNYYAENIGLIKSDANQSFMLSSGFITALNTIGVAVDFPTNGSLNNTQELESYTITESDD